MRSATQRDALSGGARPGQAEFLSLSGCSLWGVHCKCGLQTGYRATARSCATFHRATRRLARLKNETAIRIRSIPSLESPVLRSISVRGAWLAGHTSRFAAVRLLEKTAWLWRSTTTRQNLRLFSSPARGSAQITSDRTKIKDRANIQRVDSNDRRRLLSVGYPTQARTANSMQVRSRIVG
jgi:hypothetical protein